MFTRSTQSSFFFLLGIIALQTSIESVRAADFTMQDTHLSVDSDLQKLDESREELSARNSVRKRHLKKEVIQGSLALAKILGGGAAGYLLSSNPGLSIVAGSFILQQMQQDLPFLLSKLSPRGWFVSEKNEYQQLLFKLEEDFEVKRPYLSIFNEQVISKVIADTQANIDSFTSGYAYLGGLIQSSFKRLGGLLSLPVKKIRVQDQSADFSSLNAHLSTFDLSVQTEVSKLVFRLMAQSEESDYDKFKFPKASYLFVGEAGTGKTTTAEAVAQSHGMPYCRINLGSTKLSELFGSIERDNIIIGRIARCMIEPDFGKPGVNPLIFIDEIHDMLNSNHPDSNQLYTLLKILSDPDQGEIDDIGLGAKIDISRATFIFGANARPDPQRDTSNALNSRLISIEFPNLTAEQKRVVAVRSFNPLCKKYGYTSVPQDEKVLEEILSHDQEPGARVLKKVIEDYLLHRAAQAQGKIKDSVFDVAESIRRNGGRSSQNSRQQG